MINEAVSSPSMNAAENKQTRDPIVGYFASVVVAFLASGWIAGLIFELVAENSNYFSPEGWRANIAAGLFMGIVFANPVGVVIARTSIVGSVLRLIIGIGVGMAAQVAIIAPFAGDGMSPFLFLMLAVLALPVLLFTRKVLKLLFGRDIEPTEVIMGMSSWVLNLPDRIMFIVLMSASFTVFWRHSIDAYDLMIGLAVSLALFTGWVGFGLRQAPETPDSSHLALNLWLDLDPEETSEQAAAEKAAIKLKRLVRIILPGAVLLGGVTRLSADVMLRLYPSISLDSADPVAALRTLVTVAAGGLGLIFFGMLALLAFSLSLLFFIGRVRSWSARQYRQHSKILVSMMHFRSGRNT